MCFICCSGRSGTLKGLCLIGVFRHILCDGTSERITRISTAVAHPRTNPSPALPHRPWFWFAASPLWDALVILGSSTDAEARRRLLLQALVAPGDPSCRWVQLPFMQGSFRQGRFRQGCFMQGCFMQGELHARELQAGEPQAGVLQAYAGMACAPAAGRAATLQL